MGMGLLTDEELESELRNVNQVPVPLAVVEPLPTKGRGNSVAVPEIIKEIIGEAHVNGGRQEALAIADVLGVSHSSASAYANGADSTSTYNKPNEKLQNHLAAARNRITKKARRVLHSSMDELLTEGKMDNVKARDLATIARNMSAVIKDLDPPNPNQQTGSGPSIVIFAPQMRKEEHYEFVYAKD